MDLPRIAGPPSGPVAIPAALAGVVEGFAARCVWRNEPGGLTFALSRDEQGTPERFLKWAPAEVAGTLALGNEAARMTWAAQWTAVPVVLDHGRHDTGEWLVTLAMPGRSAVDQRWLAEPARAVTALGEGLRQLHDALPVAECPWQWARQTRLARIVEAVESGTHPRTDKPVGPDHLPLTEALARLLDPPDDDHLVVCHGDACAPNTLVSDDGRVAGHIDLALLGVADRWADLAVATWSTQWNYGPGWEGLLLDAYGIAPDEERLAYYRLLWDAAPD